MLKANKSRPTPKTSKATKAAANDSDGDSDLKALVDDFESSSSPPSTTNGSSSTSSGGWQPEICQQPPSHLSMNAMRAMKAASEMTDEERELKDPLDFSEYLETPFLLGTDRPSHPEAEMLGLRISIKKEIPEHILNLVLPSRREEVEREWDDIVGKLSKYFDHPVRNMQDFCKINGFMEAASRYVNECRLIERNPYPRLGTLSFVAAYAFEALTQLVNFCVFNRTINNESKIVMKNCITSLHVESVDKKKPKQSKSAAAMAANSKNDYHKPASCPFLPLGTEGKKLKTLTIYHNVQHPIRRRYIRAFSPAESMQCVINGPIVARMESLWFINNLQRVLLVYLLEYAEDVKAAAHLQVYDKGRDSQAVNPNQTRWGSTCWRVGVAFYYAASFLLKTFNYEQFQERTLKS